MPKPHESGSFDEPPVVVLDAPLSSVEIRTRRTAATAAGGSVSAARPLVLRVLRPAPDRVLPAHSFDPVRQIATDSAGRPLKPSMKKDWTTIEGTHTDGDGGDNELWQWEES